MKRSFGSVIHGQRAAPNLRALIAATLIIQAYVRGRQVRDRLPWIVAAAAVYYF